MIRDNKVLPRADSSQSKMHNNTENTSHPAGNGNFINIQTNSGESETLLSKLDNKYIKEEISGHSVFLGACFCPCLFLGHLESKVKREESFCACCSSCPRFSFGTAGCQTCCLTGVLCSLGWPCSPCLTCFLNSRSTSITNIYEHHVDRPCWNAPLFWPKTVLQHVLLHEQLEREGRLFYDWSLGPDVQQASKRDRFGMAEKAILLVGGSRVGKTDLLMKLCHRTLYEKRKKTFENNEVRVGFRPMHVSETQVSSLEFWDIPVLHLQSIHTIQADITHVLLIFDVNRLETFEELQCIYREVKAMTDGVGTRHTEYIVVAAKNDHLHYKTTADGRWDMDPNYETLRIASTWASDQNMILISTATLFNVGVNKILQTVQQSPQGAAGEQKADVPEGYEEVHKQEHGQD